jgi:endonuclease YncB( thermonuclease family)
MTCGGNAPQNALPEARIRSEGHMRRMRWAVCFIVAALASKPAAAAPQDCNLAIAEEVLVAAVSDGGAFDLADGRHIRLAAIQSPMLSLARSHVVDWPLANQAKARLAELIAGKTVALAFDERSVDRHGDVIAHVFLKNVWVQGRLIDDGFARVYTQRDVRKCAAALLAREVVARKAKRGIWALPFYAPRTPETAAGDIGTFQLVEGKVLSAVKRRDRIYLNFGADYRTDFTVTVSPRDLRSMAKEKEDPLAWNAKRVRVRGWLVLLNGPEMEVSHPEQVEVLD